MDISLNTLFFLTVVSFVAGFIDSVAGGGGLITIPSLLFAGIPPQFALGTNKLASCLGTTVAVANFARKKMIWWPLVAIGIGFALVGGLIGSRTVLAIDEAIVGKIIVILLPLAAVSLLWKKNARQVEHQSLQVKTIAFKASLLCLFIGFYDGFFGPGTGTFLTLGFFTILHLDLIKATANAKVLNLVSNFSALGMFLFHQKILFAVAIPMALSNMVGNYLGSHMAMKKGEAFIRRALLGVLAMLFGSLAWKYGPF